MTAVQSSSCSDDGPQSYDQALDDYLHRALPIISLVCWLVFAILTFFHFVLLPEDTKPYLIPLAILSMCCYLGVWLWVRRRQIIHVRLMTFCLWLPLWLTSLSYAYITRELHQSTNLLMALIASGLFIVWRRWLFLASCCHIGGWLLLLFLFWGEPLLVHYTLAFVFSFTLMWAIHIVQRSVIHKSWQSQIETRAREHELEEALRELQRAQQKQDHVLQELQSHSMRLKEILDSAPLVVCLLDLSGQILAVEGQSADLFYQQLLKPKATWVGNQSLEVFKPLITKAKRTGEAAGMLHMFDRIWNTRLRLIQKEQDKPSFYIAVLHDTTEQHESQQMRDHFVSMVSHELRTPLTAISGSLQLMLGGIIKEQEQREDMLSLMKRNAERLKKIIDDLLDLNKLKAGQLNFVIEEKELFPILQLTADTLAPYAAQQNASIQLTSSQPHLRFLVDIDEQRLQQVATNLLSNALKFSPQGEHVELVMAQVGRRVKVSVIDRGPGVAPEMQHKIFEPFIQESVAIQRTKGGTGLGLSLARQFVRQMGGDMGYESRDVGACFWFSLPIARIIEA